MHYQGIRLNSMKPFHWVCMPLMAFENADLKTSLNGCLFKHMAAK